MFTLFNYRGSFTVSVCLSGSLALIKQINVMNIIESVNSQHDEGGYL